MRESVIVLVLGGILPAILFGISGALAKPSNQSGIGTGLYILCIGASVSLIGIIWHLIIPDSTISLRSGLFASLAGCTWAVAAGLVALALKRYGVPVSKLAPLYNMNTLVTVLIGLYAFAEWNEVNSLKLLTGALLIMAGGFIVSTS
ncbi:hypothetical protein EG833_02635 [archaeon]|nr:hypothetical protein [archaeon]